MAPVRQFGAVLLLSALVTGCRNEPDSASTSISKAGAPGIVTDSTRTSDSIPEERPDSIRSTPPDSTTMLLALLPAAAGGALTGEAASLAERAVFVPRTQRWFMSRMLDSAMVMDIGRIDGGVGTSDAARAAFDAMVASVSPIQLGLSFVLHPAAGATIARVSGFRMSGRRILATLEGASADTTERAIPTEWRGAGTVSTKRASAASCPVGDTVAIHAAIARVAPQAKEAMSVLRGCFGAFRALITVRPLEITPESVERVTLVRADGTVRSGRLRDLSYPLHALLSVIDVDADGTHEIIVHSFRPAMKTWAALRMTDSIAFTRFASGFTIEKR